MRPYLGATPVKIESVDDAVGELYKQFFRLREAGKTQEEYEAMGTLVSMLQTDRAFLRSSGKAK